MAIQSHRDLVVWQKAMDLVLQVYRLSERFPSAESYRLIDQISRSVVSVPANIAEGHARGSSREFGRFLAIAKGSLMETETYVTLAVRLGYVDDDGAVPVLAQITEVSKMLTVLRKRIVP